MTFTKPGGQIGGHRTEVDQQKLGPALVITAGLILGMRTIRWEATHSDGWPVRNGRRKSNTARGSLSGCLRFSPLAIRTCFSQRKYLGMLRPMMTRLNE